MTDKQESPLDEVAKQLAVEKSADTRTANVTGQTARENAKPTEPPIVTGTISLSSRLSSRIVSLVELRAQYRGTRFYQLVEHHLRSQRQAERIQSFLAAAHLPPAERDLVEGFLSRWNARAYDRAFWQEDTAAVFDKIIDDARDVLRPLGLASDDVAAFNLFNFVVINYAYSASDQPKIRRFMRVRVGGFPWASAISLLYPISATMWIAAFKPAPPAMVAAGYGLANLGYLLFAAGIVAGTFRILGLRRRWRVIAAAVVAFAVGAVLCNLGA